MAVEIKNKKAETKKIDEELKKIIEGKFNRIKVVGMGGAGNNTITRLMNVGIVGADTVAVNTDAQDLLYSDANFKVLIGKELTGGLGAGGDPKIGAEAAKESKEYLKKVLEGTDMVFLTCGLGGGTGTGASPIIAEIARQMGILTVGVVTLPFSMEGHFRMRNAIEGLNKLRNFVDTLLIIPNDKMLEIVPNVSMPIAFRMLDEVLVNAVKGTVELITEPGLVNLDFADVRAVMRNGGLAMIGTGESNSSTRAIESATKALSDPFLPVDITGADGALINIVGGPGVTLNDANEIVRIVSERLEPDAKIVWGAKIEDSLKDKIRTMVIVTGVKETQVYGQINFDGFNKKERLEKMFDVRFIE